MDDDLEAVAVKTAATKEREYTHGWKAYVNGAARPTTQWARIGWDEAQHAAESCDRPNGRSDGRSRVDQLLYRGCDVPQLGPALGARCEG
ncbi:MAG: hypothetical protein EBR82_71825, partial [Caulobacteraceae bacterium]|nr:hypothetical protein [Caulobacteraceae bacterium]